jgi:hypothetical protein
MGPLTYGGGAGVAMGLLSGWLNGLVFKSGGGAGLLVVAGWPKSVGLPLNLCRQPVVTSIPIIARTSGKAILLIFTIFKLKEIY